ncbi:MAG: hypothetical protein DRR19_23670 [Candidatus Parabeggiatoa sp. nov. 1]|nr:MAG: hypothetical protein DRR19_23670 [Gammaproteobacteria bacterium]
MNIKLIERIDAKVNPIMVKEIYQGFRGRWFVIGYGLALLISLGGYFSVVSPSFPTYSSSGLELFKTLMFSMTLVALFIIPISAGNQLRNDITSNTLELITITHLSPWAIISGYFQAAMLKIVLLFACMGPFMMAAFLLGGIGVTKGLYSLGFLLLYALFFCALLLMVNALPALNPRYKILATIIQTLLVLLIIVGFIEARDSYHHSRVFGPFRSLLWYDKVWVNISLILVGLLLTVFFLRMAADLLTLPRLRTFLFSKFALAVSLMVMYLPFLKWRIFSTGSLVMSLIEELFFWTLFTLYFFALFWGGQVNTNVLAPNNLKLHRWREDAYILALISVIMLALSLFLTMLLSWKNAILLFCVTLLVLYLLKLSAKKYRTAPYQKESVRPRRMAELYILTLVYLAMLTFGLFLTGLLSWENLILLFFVTLLLLCLLILSLGKDRENCAQHGSIRHYLLGNGYIPTLLYVTLLTFSISIFASVSQSHTKLLWFGLYFISYYTFFSGIARMLRSWLPPRKRTVFVYLICVLALIAVNGMATIIFSTATGISPIPQHYIAYLPIIFTDLLAVVAFLPLLVFSWELTRDNIFGLWMLLPLTIGLSAAWLGSPNFSLERPN